MVKVIRKGILLGEIPPAVARISKLPVIDGSIYIKNESQFKAIKSELRSE